MVKCYSDTESENQLHFPMGYNFRLTRDLLDTMSHRQDSRPPYYVLRYTRCGALAGTRISLMIQSDEIDPTTDHIMSGRSNYWERDVAPWYNVCSWCDGEPTVLFFVPAPVLHDWYNKSRRMY